MSRCVVNVATGHYQKGQQRLREKLQAVVDVCGGSEHHTMMSNGLPWPKHSDKPYAFKSYAMREAADVGHTTLLWCDACIVPIRSLDPLWEKIEREGAWISENGWSNYEWTADSAYPDLFVEEIENMGPVYGDAQVAWALRQINLKIPHVVATAFGISLAHPTGRAILDEYYRLASETRAFCGPWCNAAHPDWLSRFPEPSTVANPHTAVCGPPDVRGHRHDQSCLSVIAWRLGVQLTKPPAWFCYEGGQTEDTILVARGI